MEREFYLNLAAGGLRMPIGTDLVLREGSECDVLHVTDPAETIRR